MRIVIGAVIALAVIAALIASYFSSGHTRLVAEPAHPTESPVPRAALPHPAHVVIVIEENKSYDDILGKTKQAPYLNGLAQRGAVFTHSYGVAHPSQPNYFALFSGRTNTNGDSCDVRGIPPDAPNLGAQLIAAHRSFVGYAEGLPAPGFRGCTAGNYARKHAPWTHFTNVPDRAIQPFTAFPHDFSRLPTVAFVIPDLEDDMHSGSIRHGDAWLARRLAPVVAWGATHDTLIIITWDESNEPLSNHIPTIFVGPMVTPGLVDETIDHYSVLRTLEDFYGLPHAGRAASAVPISQAWKATKNDGLSHR